MQYCSCRYDGTTPQRTPLFGQTPSDTPFPSPSASGMPALLQLQLSSWSDNVSEMNKLHCNVSKMNRLHTASVAAIVMARQCYINELFSCNYRHGQTMFQKWTVQLQLSSWSDNVSEMNCSAATIVMARQCFIKWTVQLQLSSWWDNVSKLNRLHCSSCSYGETMFHKWIGYTAATATIVMLIHCFRNE